MSWVDGNKHAKPERPLHSLLHFHVGSLEAWCVTELYHEGWHQGPWTGTQALNHEGHGFIVRDFLRYIRVPFNPHLTMYGLTFSGLYSHSYTSSISLDLASCRAPSHHPTYPGPRKLFILLSNFSTLYSSYKGNRVLFYHQCYCT